MSASSSKPPPPHHHLPLHVDSTSATAATTTTKQGSADASPGSASSSRSSRTTRPATPAGGGGGSGGWHVQACAACKFQRRKCSPDCPLAPYFPADQQRRFLDAHRLFGVSNIQKTLRRVQPKLAPDAMRALIYESEARAADPVGGCVGIIEELLRQIHTAEAELQCVRQQIAICRGASATNSAAMAGAGQQQQDDIGAVDALYAGQQPIQTPEGGAGLIFHDQQDYNVLQVEEQNNHQQQQLYDYLCYNNGTAGDEATSHDGGMQQYGDVLHPEQKKLATPDLMKHVDEDEHMEEQQAPAGAPCHLELGFSSFLSNA